MTETATAAPGDDGNQKGCSLWVQVAGDSGSGSTTASDTITSHWPARRDSDPRLELAEAALALISEGHQDPAGLAAHVLELSGQLGREMA